MYELKRKSEDKIIEVEQDRNWQQEGRNGALRRIQGKTYAATPRQYCRKGE